MLSTCVEVCLTNIDTDRTDNDRMTYDRKNRVFIGGITEDIQKDEIEKEFNKYGKLTSVCHLNV